LEIGQVAAPIIALRFRDTTLGVDTISEHRALLAKRGCVWWGWWKKDFEEDRAEIFAELSITSGEFDVIIIDPSTDRMFVAKVIKWVAGSADGVDANLVPTYYRSHIQQVYGWFLLTELKDVRFDPKIAARFDEETLVSLKEAAPSPAAAEEQRATGRTCILHLSDLHFGADYGFLPQGEKPEIGDTRKTLTEALRLDLNRLGITKEVAAILVTGDFTTQGDWSDDTKRKALAEFAEMRRVLDLEPSQIVSIPGNHDIVRYPEGVAIDPVTIAVDHQTRYQHETGFRTFQDELTGRDWKLPLNYVQRFPLRDVDLVICGVNSCRIVATKWTEYGYVGEHGIDLIRSLGDPVSRPTFKILALHHHLLPVASVEAPKATGVSLSLDACAIIDAAQAAGVHIAVHGHQHLPRLSRYQSIPLMSCGETSPMYILSNGSSGVIQGRRGEERNTYAVFRFERESVKLWLRELRRDGKGGAELLSETLDLQPTNP
jgi:predicted phosphodiesterase